MEEEEIAKVLRRIEIVVDWFDEMSGGEYSINNYKAQELLVKLEGVKIKEKWRKVE